MQIVSPIYLICRQTTIICLHFLQKEQGSHRHGVTKGSYHGFEINTGIYQLGTGMVPG